jgi:nicotinate dehydrogenase subunit A
VTAFVVNGVARSLALDPQTQLLYVLRNDLGLKGTRFGCGEEQCGSCLVLVDGKPVCACTLPLSALEGRTVTTVEGLGDETRPHPVQAALLEEQAAQCGYCISGIVVRAAALLASNPSPDDAAVREALDANLCRCGAHNRIVRAVLLAAERMRENTR